MIDSNEHPEGVSAMLTSKNNNTPDRSEVTENGTDMTEVDELISDLAADFESPPVTPVLKRLFKPWHKPRKHYIRIHQWCVELKKLLPALNLAHRTVSYLGLPGRDMLDIKTLHGVCESKGVKLRYLGFNGSGTSSDTAEASLSDNELRSQGWEFIDHVASRTMFDPFERVSVASSLAHKALLEKASFDVVNLDLCNCIARRCSIRAESTLEALKVLMDVQHARRAEPWLLFVTTRTVRDGVDPDIWILLCKLVDKNLTNHEFRTLFGTVCLLATGQSFTDLESSLVQSTFSKSFGIALGKWVLNRISLIQIHL